MRHLTLALILCAAPAAAQDKPNLDPAAPAMPGAVALLVSAQNLYALGQSAKDPLMVLTAARMMRGLTLIPTAPGCGAAALHLPDADAMLTTARAFAAGDDTLPDLIESIATESAPQPKSLRVTPAHLDPGGTGTWVQPFYGGTYAELGIMGGGQGNLDLSVTDDKGNPVCEDNGSADTATCGFTPKDNGDFTITVTNPGLTADAYLLVTN